MRLVLVSVLVHLYGAVPFAYVAILLLKRQDITKLGTGNVSVINAFHDHGRAHLAYAILVNIVFALAVIPEARTYLTYRREGKLDGYREGLMASSPRWRGMKNMADHLSIFRRR